MPTDNDELNKYINRLLTFGLVSSAAAIVLALVLIAVLAQNVNI